MSARKKGSEVGTRYCRACKARKPLSAFDLTKRTYRCLGCSRTWVARRIALVRLRAHYDHDIEKLASALELSVSTVKSYLFSPWRITGCASWRIRDAYIRVQGSSVHVQSTADELEARVRKHAAAARASALELAQAFEGKP